MKSHCIHRKYM